MTLTPPTRPLATTSEMVRSNYQLTELLHKHDNPRRPGSTSVSRNREQFHKHGKEIFALVHFPLDLNSDVRIVQIPSCLQVTWAQCAERPKGLFHFIVLDEPSRRFRAVIHLSADNQRQNYSRTKHETPCKVRLETSKSYTHDIPQHDTESSPPLPG